MFSSSTGLALLEEAVLDGRSDVDVVAHEVGASAAQVGIPLHEVLDHVERAHAGREPAYRTIRAAVLAWVDSARLHDVDMSCEDPLTSLSTIPHLRTRLGDIYRGAERDGTQVGATYALVVVELPRRGAGNELECSLRALDVATAMRTVFAGGETIAGVSPRRFAALVNGDRCDTLTLGLLRLLLERTDGDGLHVRVWVEQLPSDVSGVAGMLVGLCE